MIVCVIFILEKFILEVAIYKCFVKNSYIITGSKN